MITITLHKIDHKDIYNLYQILSESGRRCSSTVHQVSEDWLEMLAKEYKGCYNTNRLYSLVFRGQDSDILLHIVDEFVCRTGGNGYNGMGKRIHQLYIKDK